MTKTVQGQNTAGEYKKRLQEIAGVQFGTLSDDEILRFLAERKRLSDVEREYERVQKEEVARLEQEKKKEDLKAAEKKKTVILKKIEELNKSISGEVSDDDLLIRIAHRKELEKELEESDGGVSSQKEEISPTSIPSAPVSAPEVPSENESAKSEIEVQRVAPKEAEEAGGSGEKKAVTDKTLSRGPKDRVEEEYGDEKISNSGIEEGTEFQRYFDQLRNNVGSLGTLLQSMPLDAKKNKAFMLRVAKIDPAYAMHFADKETLKKDEDFNLRIASLDNPRNSGNALAEMLPEARTSRVLLAAVKQDYRNVRFIQPNMADYDEMMSIAKREALEKVKNLKEATDVLLLIPKLLQQDAQFMLQVKEITDPKKAGETL